MGRTAAPKANSTAAACEGTPVSAVTLPSSAAGTAMLQMPEQRVLEVDGLTVRFATSERTVDAVRKLSFHVERSETLAIVGESGSGKSVTSLALMRLVEYGGGRIPEGRMAFRRRDGRVLDLAKAPDATMRGIRGADIAMIFQEPMTSLNPVFTAGDQIAEAIAIHQGKDRAASRAEALRMLELVRIPEARSVLQRYPHQLSGGMRQRVMIAMALSCRPALLIADEPTTALDVTIQAQILDLLRQLVKERDTALNPAYTIGDQLMEPYLHHRKSSVGEARNRAVELLGRVGIASAASRLGQYPHQLSGGLRQRVMIAMALMCGPELLIADEPSTALDVTIQAQILRLLADLREELGIAMVLITHDLGVVARVAQRVAVMYAGEVVEEGAVAEVFAAPRHPYTRGLLSCIPVPGRTAPGGTLGTIPGTVPSLVGAFEGCGFRDRCGHARPVCRQIVPLRQSGVERRWRCVLGADTPNEVIA